MAKRKIELFADFVDFLATCNQHGLLYLVIGGYAVSIHGYPRSTKDLDICIKASPENARKMVAVLKDFGFGSLPLHYEDFLRLHEFVQIGYPPLRIDIMNDFEGIDFDEAYGNRKEVIYEEIPIPFVGYQDLLTLKRMAGRPQDIADIYKLEKRQKGSE